MKLPFVTAFGPVCAGLALFLFVGPVQAADVGSGYALRFDGVDDCLQVTNFGAVTPTNEITIEFWQKVDAAVQQFGFSTQPNTPTNRISTHNPWSDGRVYWDFGNSANGGQISFLPGTPLTNAWHHFALVASQSGNYMRIYQNGFLKTSPGIAGMTPFRRGTYDLAIGGQSPFFGGVLDEFRIWNQARDLNQILTNMNRRMAGNEAGLVACYHFDEGGGSLATNAVAGGGLSGVLTAGPVWEISTAPVGAPTVALLPFGPAATNKVTLRGTVLTAAQTTTVYFRYGSGAGPGYMSTTAVTNLSATNLAEVTVEIVTPTLSKGTLYRYILTATNTGGITTSAQGNFQAPDAPGVTTGTATGLNGTNAVLTADVNPNGLATTAYVEWGSTTNYGQSTALTNLPAGNAVVPLGFGLTNLVRGSTYHFRAVGSNSLGTVRGLDGVWVASSLVATTLGATGVGTSAATLNGSVAVAGEPAGVYFEWGTTTNYGGRTESVTVTNTGTGLSLKGTGQYVTFPAGTYFTNDFTVEARVQPRSIGSWARLLDFGNGQANDNVIVALSSGTTGKPALSVYQGATGKDLAAASILPQNQWSHLAVTLSGTNGSIYINGNLAGSGAMAVPASVIRTNNFLGRSNFSGDPDANAIMDEIRLWNYARSAANLQADMNRSLAGNETGLVAYWRCDEGSGLGLADATAGGKNGSLSGEGLWLDYTNAHVQTLTNLSPKTTYHYRLVATNRLGQATGDDLTFTTAGAPDVTTLDATGITDDSAVLQGSFASSGGVGAVVYFQYGLTTNYGQVSSSQSFFGNTSQSFTRTVTALAPATLYHFRAVATNTLGIALGTDGTFQTTNITPVVSTQTAINITSTNAALRATVNPKGVTTAVYFQYGSTTNYGSFSATNILTGTNGNVAVTNLAEDLSPGTVYQFRAVADNGLMLVNGQNATLTASPAPPGVQTLVPATGQTNGTATLKGTVNPSGASTSAYFEYGLTTDYGLRSPTNVLTGATNIAISRTVTNLAAATIYHVRLRAFNSQGSADGDDVVFLTPNEPPAAATQAATDVNGTTGVLRADIRPNGIETAFYFQYGTTASYAFRTETNLLAATNQLLSVAMLVTNLVPGTNYQFRVVASNSLGTTNGENLSFTVPTAPLATTLAASGVTSNAATLNGTANPVGLPGTVYFEYGLTTNYGSFSDTNSLAVTNAFLPMAKTLTNLLPGNRYHYRTVARNDLGVGSGTNVTFVTPAVAPTVVTLAASDVTSNSATLNGTVNPGGTNTSYQFQYGTTTNYSSATTETPLAPGNATLNLNTPVIGLTLGTPYHYRLRAWNSKGTNNGANLTVTPRALPTLSALTVSGITGRNVQWNATVNPNGAATQVYLEYGLTTNYGLTALSKSFAATNTAQPVSQTVTNLTVITAYHSRLVASNSVGVVQSADVPFTTLAAPPALSGLTAVNVGGDDALWNATINPNGAETQWYFQYGPTTNYGSYSTTNMLPGVDAALAVSNLLTGLTENTLYHFRLVATNSAGGTSSTNRTFTTGIPPSFGSVRTTNLQPTQVMFVGAVEPRGQTSTVLYYEWGTDTNYGGRSAAIPVGAQTALNLNGTNQYLSLAGTLVKNRPFTMEAWVFLRSYTGGARLLDFGGIAGTDTGWNITLVEPGNNRLSFSTTYQDTTNKLVAPVVLPLQTWIHLAVSMSNTGLTRIYTNGVETTNQKLTIDNTDFMYTNYVGRANAGGGFPNAAIDELRLWSDVRTPAELADSLTRATPVPSANLSHLWRFEEGSGSTTKDSTSASYPGTLLGGASWTNGPPTEYRFTVTNLAPGVTYHYRLVTTNNAGVDAGPDQTFTTPAGVPAVVTLPATNLAHTGALLQGTINPNGAASGPAFEYGETTNYGSVLDLPPLAAGTEPVTVTNRLSGLLPGTTIHYRLRATNTVSGGTNRYGADMVFQTVPPPTVSPVPVSGPGPWQWQFQGGAGLSYTLQGSSNLLDWTDLTNGTADATGSLRLTDPELTNRLQQFYRLRNP